MFKTLAFLFLTLPIAITSVAQSDKNRSSSSMQKKDDERYNSAMPSGSDTSPSNTSSSSGYNKKDPNLSNGSGSNSGSMRHDQKKDLKDLADKINGTSGK